MCKMMETVLCVGPARCLLHSLHGQDITLWARVHRGGFRRGLPGVCEVMIRVKAGGFFDISPDRVPHWSCPDAVLPSSFPLFVHTPPRQADVGRPTQIATNSAFQDHPWAGRHGETHANSDKICLPSPSLYGQEWGDPRK